jgi:micrococcal nuclease
VLPTAAPTAAPVFAPTGDTTQATVTRVIDGDTIIVLVGDTEYRVRYLDVDAPASVSLDRPVEFMGRDAADANRRLVSSAAVVLERDQSETDDHGQLLRHVWVDHDGTLALVGLEMVRAGLARTAPSAQDTKYTALFEDAQQAARSTGIGIWSSPPLPVTGPTPAPVEASLPRLVRADPITIYSSAPTRLTGAAGVYTWRSVGFADANVQLDWDVKASATRSCEFDWRLEPASGAAVGSTLDVPVRGRETGGRTLAIDFTDALLVTTTTCPDWSFSMQGTEAP